MDGERSEFANAGGCRRQAMNHGPLIFLGVFLAMALSWHGMVVVPQVQLGRLQQTNVPPAGAQYPTLRSGVAQQGREVYRANGCYYCHTQQARGRAFGADIERGWGQRHSVATDFLFETPVMVGSLRAGPDLMNIGGRQPDAASQMLHLYDPRITAKGSTMPRYRFLFDKRKIGQRPSLDALKLPGEFAPEAGYEIVPKPEAQALVAYLLSLQASVSLFEAPLPQAPRKPEADAWTNQPPVAGAASTQPAGSASPTK